MLSIRKDTYIAYLIQNFKKLSGFNKLVILTFNIIKQQFVIIP